MELNRLDFLDVSEINAVKIFNVLKNAYIKVSNLKENSFLVDLSGTPIRVMIDEGKIIFLTLTSAIYNPNFIIEWFGICNSFNQSIDNIMKYYTIFDDNVKQLLCCTSYIMNIDHKLSIPDLIALLQKFVNETRHFYLYLIEHHSHLLPD